MPSWNIHTAHTQRLFLHESPSKLGVRDLNAFMFGNLVPDIYVGYVVPDVSRKIEYRSTHLVDASFIPSPNAALFYERYLMQDDANDLVLGAWTHLICDHYYNLRTTEFIASIGVEPSDETRERKQADFDAFGRTLDISWVPTASDELIQLCARFPQYEICEPDVYATIRAQEGIVRRNAQEHIDGVPAYRMLTQEYFTRTFNEVDGLLREALHLRAKGILPTSIGRA